MGELQSPPTPSTDTSLSRRLRPTGVTGPGSYQITCFALGACVHEILCEPIETEVSVFPSPVGLLLLGPAGWHLPGARPLGWGGGEGLTCSSEFLLLLENLCNIFILQFVGCLSEHMEFDITSLPACLGLWLLLYIFNGRRPFLGDSGLFHQWLLCREL